MNTWNLYCFVLLYYQSTQSEQMMLYSEFLLPLAMTFHYQMVCSGNYNENRKFDDCVYLQMALDGDGS